MYSIHYLSVTFCGGDGSELHLLGLLDQVAGLLRLLLSDLLHLDGFGELTAEGEVRLNPMYCGSVGMAGFASLGTSVKGCVISIANQQQVDLFVNCLSASRYNHPRPLFFYWNTQLPVCIG